MKKLLASIIILASIFQLLTSNVMAQYGEYGEEQPSFSLSIDKMVGKPFETKGGFTDQDYVDNLSPSDPRFSPGQEVFFKIKVKNTSDVKLKDVTVKDFLPDFVEPVEGLGSFDSDSREITISAGDIEVDEEKVFFIKAKVLAQDQLPEDKGLICLVNKAQAYDGGASDEDTAQFCIEKEVLGVTAVPSAGPEMGMVLLMGEMALLSAGIYLKRKV